MSTFFLFTEQVCLLWLLCGVIISTVNWGVGTDHLDFWFIALEIKRCHIQTWYTNYNLSYHEEGTSTLHSDILDFEFNTWLGIFKLSPWGWGWACSTCVTNTALNFGDWSQAIAGISTIGQYSAHLSYEEHRKVYFLTLLKLDGAIWSTLVNELWPKERWARVFKWQYKTLWLSFLPTEMTLDDFETSYST